MGYWEDRANKDIISAMNTAEVTAEELQRLYYLASAELILRSQKIFETYQDKFGLTEEEAIQLLNGSYDIEGLKNALRNASNEESLEILAKLESGAYRARLKRIEALEKQIDALSRELFMNNNKITSELLIKTFGETYYRKIWGIQRQVGFQFSFSHIDKKVVNSILTKNWSGENYSERIWNNTEILAQRVKKDVLVNYLTGKTPEDLAQDITKEFSTSAFNSRRLIRTETAYVYEQASQEAYKEAGIEKYQILATLDTKTSKVCQELDGKQFAVGTEVTGVTAPPFHPFCRTTTKAVVTEDTENMLMRRARNPVTGKNELVPASMNYRSWAKQNGINIAD